MTPRFTRVLAATDFSPIADRAVPYAYSIVAPGGEVHLVHVLEVDVPNPLIAHYTSDALLDPHKRRRIVADLEERLARLVPPDGDPSVRTTVAAVLHPDVAQGLLDEARARDASVLVIGSHGRTGLGHLLMGSVAERVLRGANVPVLIVPRKTVG